MPRATHNPDTTVRHELETLPEGYVVLKKMTYGERTRVREMAMRASMPRDSEALDMQVNLLSVDEFEFAASIVDHNLEDENGKLLDFKKGGTVSRLEPEIGAEISQLITELNEGPESPKAVL